MNNIEGRDLRLPYISDDLVREEQRITRRIIQEFNTTDRGYFENLKSIAKS